MSPTEPSRIDIAEHRARDAHRSVRRRAEAVLQELDDITDHGGVPQVELHEEDSLVIVVAEAIGDHKKRAVER